jgi:hypothetical protein
VDPVTAAVLGIALQSPFTEYNLCFNDDCVKYMCNIAPSYTHEAGVTRVHTPCLPVNIVCQGQSSGACTVDGITIEQMPNKQGLIITGAELNEQARF